MTANTTSERARGSLIDTEFENPDFFSAIIRLEQIPHHVRRYVLNDLRGCIETMIYSRGLDLDEVDLAQRNGTVVVLIDSDEDGFAVGPRGFKERALQNLFSGASAILLYTCDVRWNPYPSISKLATRRGRYVVVVESYSEREAEWRAEIEPHCEHALCVFAFGTPFKRRDRE